MLKFAILPLLVDLLLGAGDWRTLRAGLLSNPDSYMRLARLKEMFAAGRVQETVSHGASGMGFVLHWSHLLDALLCLIAAPFALVFSWHQALLLASDIMGPLQMVGLAVAMAWAVSPFVDRAVLWLAPLMAALPQATFDYALPGVSHHHVLSLTIVVIIGGLAARAVMAPEVVGTAPLSSPLGWKIGFWSGLGVWLTPETVPLITAAFGLLYVGWLSARTSRPLAVQLRDAGLSFLISVSCALAIDPPAGGFFAPEVDRISLLFLGLAAVAAAMGWAILTIDRRIRAWQMRLLASVSFGVVAGGAWLLAFYGTLLGPGAEAENAALTVMHGLILEMKPVNTVGAVLAYLFTGGLGTLLLAVLALRKRSAVLAFATLISLVMLFVAQRHLRFSCYPGTVGAVMLTVVVSYLCQPALAWPESKRACLRITACALFGLPPLLGNFLLQTPTSETGSGCSVSQLGPLLAPYANKVVLTEANVVPELLYRTDIDTVGSLYLRNAVNFIRLRDMWHSPPSDVVPPLFKEARVEFVLFCHGDGQAKMAGNVPAKTLADQLARGQPPVWLRQVAAEPGSGNVLFKVVN